jgi:hypothetical protein
MIFFTCRTVYFPIRSIILTSHDLIKSNEVKRIDLIGKEIRRANKKNHRWTLSEQTENGPL